MLNWLKSRIKSVDEADRLYGALVAQARTPAFYAHLGVPDTMEGRYELVVLHLFLVLERLRDEGAGADLLSRGTLERFVEDMDDCMREIGVGDLKVPKKVKKAAAGFYERAGQLRPLLSDGTVEPLAAHLATVLIGEIADPGSDPRALALAGYVRNSVRSLAATPFGAIREGHLAFAPLDPLELAQAGKAPQ